MRAYTLHAPPTHPYLTKEPAVVLVLDTVAPTTLAARYNEQTAWTVETTIKSLAGLPGLDLQSIIDAAGQSEGHRKAAFVARVALALVAEREAAHADAIIDLHHGTVDCDGCAGDGVYRFPGGCFENGVWRGKTGTCYRCGGTGRQVVKDVKRNRYYDNHVRRVYA